MLVKEVMSDVVAISPDTEMVVAFTQMVETRSSCLVMVESGLPVGIVTERDVVMEFTAMLAKQTQKRTIEEIMTREPVCVKQDCEFKEALMLSRSRNLRHLPVIDENDHLVGMVTQTNLVNAYAHLVEKQDELISSVEEFKVLSLEDPLMRIGNRRAMEVDLAFTEAEAKRHHKTYAVALVDVDMFKKYNDHYGHQDGDTALKQLADIIRATVRESDRVFRYGGEEILVLMPETNDDAAMICSERIRKAVEQANIEHIKAPSGVLTISAGVAAAKEASWYDLVGQADKALYQAKLNGRNRVELASAEG